MKSWLTPPPRTRTWLLLIWWATMYLLTHIPGIDDWQPRGGWPIHDPDKIVHFVLFGTWACLWVWVLAAHGRRLTRSVAFWLLAGAALYAAFDELTQSPVGRTPDIGDWILDMIGCGAGVFIAHLWQRRQPARSEARRT